MNAPVRRAAAADLLRAACIFIIAWYHIWQQSWLNPNIHIGNHIIDIYPVVSHGYMFVDIMLLISGFLLMLGYTEGRYKSLKNYYLSRFFRIVPCYLFSVLSILFLQALPQHLYGSREYMLKDVLSHLTFTHNLFPEGYASSQLNVVLWTLAVEVQFYVIFPFVAKLFRKHPAPVYLAMLALSGLYKVWVWKVPANTALYINRLPAMLDVYANGMLAALIYARLREKDGRHFIRNIVCLVLTAASCWVFFMILRRQSYIGDSALERIGQMAFRWPLTAAGCVFLICGSLSFGWVSAIMSNPVTRGLCFISYNFYIWHQFIAVKLKAWRIPYYTGENPNFSGVQPWQTQYTLMCFASAALFALIVTFAVEVPFTKLGRRLISRKKV